MILVTGATGYVGSAVVAALIARGHPVRAGVRDPARAAVVPAGAERVPLDLDDRESVRSAVRGCDGVVHCAQARGLGFRPAGIEEGLRRTARWISSARRRR